MTRDELLDKLAMELEEWPVTGSGSGLMRLPGKCWWGTGEITARWLAWPVKDDDGRGAAIGESDWAIRRTQLINKPSWEEVEVALPGADWMAQDANGWWHAYRCDKSPRAFDTCFVFASHSLGESIGVVKGAIPEGHNWRDTLERRPEEAYDEARMDAVGQNGATGEHYDEARDAVSALFALREAVRSASPIVPDEPDPVNHPDHYQSDNGIECIDAIRAALGKEGFIAYCRGNALKYAFRSGRKQKHAEDLRKGAWYLERAAQALEE